MQRCIDAYNAFYLFVTASNLRTNENLIWKTIIAHIPDFFYLELENHANLLMNDTNVYKFFCLILVSIAIT